MRILFEVSGLEEGSTNALTHYEVEFTEPVNADWLIHVIRQALDAAEPATAPDQATVPLEAAEYAHLEDIAGRIYICDEEVTMIPDVIFLQWFDEDGEKSEDVTWCEDRINNTDIEYRRLTPAAPDGAEHGIEVDRVWCLNCGEEIELP